jgi:Spy/CpxP family protein refolding chaperone
MPRFMSQVIFLTAVAGLLVSGTSALAQTSRSSKRPSANAGSPPLSIPGFWALGLDSVQKELRLSDLQKRQLRQIGDTYQAKALEAEDNLRRLPPEEQRLQAEALREHARRDMETVRKQVVEALTPQQLQAYHKIDFRLRVPTALSDARVLSALEVSDQQRARLRQVREAMEAKFQQLQAEAAEKTLEVLTPDQRAQLKEQLDK